jgi:hypothetical protein
MTLDQTRCPLRDPTTWPAVPEPALRPLTEADWRRMVVSPEDLARMAVKPADLVRLPADAASVERG